MVYERDVSLWEYFREVARLAVRRDSHDRANRKRCSSSRLRPAEIQSAEVHAIIRGLAQDATEHPHLRPPVLVRLCVEADEIPRRKIGALSPMALFRFCR